SDLSLYFLVREIFLYNGCFIVFLKALHSPHAWSAGTYRQAGFRGSGSPHLLKCVNLSLRLTDYTIHTRSASAPYPSSLAISSRRILYAAGQPRCHLVALLLSPPAA